MGCIFAKESSPESFVRSGLEAGRRTFEDKLPRANFMPATNSERQPASTNKAASDSLASRSFRKLARSRSRLASHLRKVDDEQSQNRPEPDSSATSADAMTPLSLSAQTRTRGNHVYKQAKECRDPSQLRIALSIYARAVEEASISDANARDVAAANKNCLKTISLLLQWDHEDNPDGLTVDSAFLATNIKEACESFDAAAHAAKQASLTEAWSTNLHQVYEDHLRRVVDIAAVAGPDAETTSSAYSFPERGKHLRQYQIREDALRKILSVKDCPLHVKIRAHFKAAELMIKASVVSLSHGDFQNAVSIISKADPHKIFLTDMSKSMASAVSQYPIHDIQNQVEYQRCAAESSQKIQQGLQVLDGIRAGNSKGEYEIGSILPAIDLFKNAQALARGTSLEQEAQAAARLGKIFSTFPEVRDDVKATTYYNNAFNLLHGIGLQAHINEDWAIDTRLARERIQKDNSVRQDAKKEPVLEKNREMLQGIRIKLGTSYLADDVETALLFLYEKYPPRNAKPPKEKMKKGSMKAAVKEVLLHYHPDRNGEAVHGFEHAVLCEEVTKYLNLMYARLFKDL